MIDTKIDAKLEKLNWYVKRGWPLFPCGPDKKPLTKNGFKDASLDIEKIKAWHYQNPGANWGMPTGPKTEGGADIVAIDIDHHPAKGVNGFPVWEMLREEHSQPIETVTVITGGGGKHLYFKYPAGHVVKSGTDVLGKGIDLRARGGYVIVPPSITEQPYIFEFSPADTEIQEMPAWILARVNGETLENAEEPKPSSAKQSAAALVDASKALNSLSRERADNYESWLHVGMALHELGNDGLIAWDSWSKQSEKYVPGACAKKWLSFTDDLTAANRISLKSLFHWAKEDGGQPYIKPAKKGASPAEYAAALHDLGFHFTLNEMNDLVYVNGQPVSDILTAVIEYQLRSLNYKSEKDTKITIYKTAHDKKFHPIKDYLEGLIFAGGNDPIGRLCEFFEDKDGVFKTLLTKWLVGSVGRILGDRPGQQHPMMVLDGPQGIGKSRFVSWLGSPLPAFYLESKINTEDKDFLINLCSKWVWEVGELGGTIRKSDQEALKDFLSKEIVNVRKPYGHDSITKPATASFIGTINNSGGFLADPTGSRRFRVCTLKKIDWGYDSAVDVNQVWAQARELYYAGERWTLEAADEQKMREINSRYDVDDPLQFDIFSMFNVDPAETDRTTPTASIIDKLRTAGKIGTGNDIQIAQRISNILTKCGCEKKQARVNGQPVRMWVGVWDR